jgi:ataxia telangiectasia mutated family protein
MRLLALDTVIPFIYQLASRLEEKQDSFQKTLDDLLVRIAGRHLHVVWPLLLIRNGDKISPGSQGKERYVPNTGKIKAATRVLERIKREHKSANGMLEAMESLSQFYLNLAAFPVDAKRTREIDLKLPQIQGYREVREHLKKVAMPVPTVGARLQDLGGAPAVTISFFTDSVKLAPQGRSCPKIIKLTDSAGVEHQQLAKGNDDLRQDAVMQQLFGLVNDVFIEHARSRETNLRLRTFQVVPLAPTAGIMEFVAGAPTVGEVLTGNHNPSFGAHARYRPTDWNNQKVREVMTEARKAHNAGQRDALEKALLEVYRNFKPVMHLYFLEHFHTTKAWHCARQEFARSVAVSSIVGYIVGLGDRHPNNILFTRDTGEIVHIDFGITFEAGRRQAVPEQVPFRLTRDMVDGLGCLSTCGLFRRCCETTMEVLRESAPLVRPSSRCTSMIRSTTGRSHHGRCVSTTPRPMKTVATTGPRTRITLHCWWRKQGSAATLTGMRWQSARSTS